MPDDQVAAIPEDDSNITDDAAIEDLGVVGEAPKPARGLFLLGLMLGSAVGAAIALLYTPKAVDKMRQGHDAAADDLDDLAAPLDAELQATSDASEDVPL